MFSDAAGRSIALVPLFAVDVLKRDNAMAVSMLEEFLLLTLEDAGGQFDTVPDIVLSCGVAGAVLMDLSLQGRIDSDLSAVWVVDQTPTGDAILDEVLAQVAAAPEKLDVGAWLRKLSITALGHRQTAVRRLCDRGILTQVDVGFQWVMQSRRYPVSHGSEMIEAKERLIGLILSDDIPTPHDCALVSLAAACHVFERIMAPNVFVGRRARISQLASLDLIGGRIATAAHVFTAELKKRERGAILAGMAGNVVEWYDFSIYGYFAIVVGPLFFPSTEVAVTLMATFGVFAVGLLGRPIGALLIGHVSDRMSRRQAVMLSVALMAIPSLLTGILPTYAQVGVLAPLGLLLMRFFQGIAVGGEYASSSVMLVESAMPSRRGFISSLSKASATIGLMIGSGMGALIMALLPALWGWRVAFIFGLLLSLMAFEIRRRLPHDETAAAAAKSRTTPVVEVFRDHWRTVLKMSGLVASGFIGAYLAGVYLVTWLTENTALGEPEILLINMLVLGVSLFLTPLFSALSDRVGRKPLLILGSLAAELFTVPLFMLMQGASAALVLVARLALTVLLACMNGGSTVYLVESFPRHLRTSGLAISLTIAAVLFGGTLPVIAVWLTGATGSVLAPAWYFVAAALLTAVLAIPMRNLDKRPDVS